MATSRRQRGVILTQVGLQKLQATQRRSEVQDNDGTRYTLEQLSDRMGLDPGTVSKVLAAEIGVDKQTLVRAFAAFELELTTQDFQKVAQPKQFAPVSPSPYQDWGDAVDTTHFYGRIEEVHLLSQWIKQDGCRLIAILGIGGIGKTTLATRLSESLSHDFEFVIWRSLRHAPPLEELLADVTHFLSRHTEITFPLSPSAQILRFIEYLRQHRCLIILDNLESILQEGVQAGAYRPGYDNYGELLQRLGSARHQSCILLTSREKPSEVAHLEGQTLPVRSLRLAGLEPNDAESILQDKGLEGDQLTKQQLVDRYRGHPLALKVVSTSICDLFEGKIAEFLRQDATLFSSLRTLLDQQFNRLTSLEQQVMYWLAIEREAVTVSELREAMVPTVAPQVLIEVLESLRRRSLIESNQSSFTQQSVVMEYVTERLIQLFCQIICKPPSAVDIGLLHSHALLKATTKDHIREAQSKLIAQPLIDELIHQLGDRSRVEHQLMQWVGWQQQQVPTTSSYLGGNVLNLLALMGSDLSDRDFSHLAIRQADLRQVSLHGVNFAHTDLSHTVFAQTFGGILSVAFNPTGELFAAGDDHNEIRLWDVFQEQPHLILRGHTDWVWSVVFSPREPILASASEDQTVRLWDIETGQCLRVLRGHTSWVRSLSMSPDGRTIASGSSDHTIKLWDVQTGTCYNTLKGHDNWVWSVCFSPDGQTIVSGGTDQTVRLWDVSTGECLRIFNGHEGAVYEVAFSPNGEMLASCGYDQAVRLWALNGISQGVLTGHRSAIRSVAFSPNGQRLASGSNDQTVRLWDSKTGQCIRVLHAEANWVRAIAFSPTNPFLVTGSNAQTLRLWQVETGHCLRTWHGQTGQVWAVAYAPQALDSNDIDGQLLASGSGDHDIHLWRPATRNHLKTLQGHTNWVWSIAFHPQEPILASGSEDETIRLWHHPSGQCLRTIQGHTGAIRSVAFSPDGNHLASASEDATVRLWDWRTGAMLQSLCGHTNWVRSVAFSPDGNWLASGSLDCTARIWVAQTGACHQILAAHTGSVRSVAFSPDGKWLATGSEDETVRLWDIQTGECLTLLKGGIGQVWCVCFSPNGLWLAIASTLPEIQVWDLRLNQKMQTLQGHTGQNWSVVFSPDGQFLASGSADETIRCWEVDRAQCITVLQPKKRYDSLNIFNTTGLTSAQRMTLNKLGAVSYID